MNFKDITIGEMLENEELRKQAQEHLKERLEAPENDADVKSFGGLVIDILNVIQSTGNKIIENHQEITSALSVFEKLLSLSDEELRAVIDDQFTSGKISKSDHDRIMTQIYKTPSFLSLLNSKVTNKMFNGTDLSEPQPVRVSPRNAKNEYIVNIHIPTEHGELPEGLLTKHDELVHMAVCTLSHNGYSHFTAKQISTFINGKESKSKVAIEKVDKALKKLGSTWFSLDWSEHARMNGITDQDFTMTWEGTILSLERCTINSYGQEVSAYRLNRQPILYEYNKAVKQIIPLERKYVDIKSVSMTDDARALTYYMAKQIKIMSHPHNKMSHSMLFGKIFEECGITGNAKQIQRKRDIAFKILDEWVEMGFIKAYKKKIHGRSCLGVDIVI